MRSFTYNGKFWIPGNKENAFTGTLLFNPKEKIELCSLDALVPSKLVKGPIISIINGNLSIEGGQQEEVTLYRVLKRHPMVVYLILWGAHFPNEEALFFKEFSFSFLCSVQGMFSKSVSLNGAIVTIDFNKLSISDPVVTISFGKSQDLNECLSCFGELLKFFTLLLLEKITPLSLYAVSDTGKKVEIFYAHPIFQDENAIKWSLNMDNIPKAIEEKLEKALIEWFKKTEEFRLLTDLYFSAVYNFGISFLGNLEQPFLLLATAIERYHHILSNRGVATSKEENTALKEINQVLKSCSLSQNARDFWEKNKKELIRKSLMQQLEDIYSHRQETLNILGFIKDEVSRKKFFRKVRDYRANIAHGRKRPGTEELHKTFCYLRLFIELCLLAELGFTPEECKEIMKQSPYFHNFGIMESKNRTN